ncbi:hypothetical protein WJX75_008443 [Coccomyxa subellipsoidea]|uniref:FAD-binding domain-containing protein n=1 Tax=Coccomyxa subellipsoidea TaxID=248742 RepID=A0ABR2YJV9_9CHLO
MQRRYAHAALWPIVFVLLGLVLVKADTTEKYSAPLLGDEVIPGPVNTKANGTADVSFTQHTITTGGEEDRHTVTIWNGDYTITVANLDNVHTVEAHQAPRGAVGELVYYFYGPNDNPTAQIANGILVSGSIDESQLRGPLHGKHISDMRDRAHDGLAAAAAIIRALPDLRVKVLESAEEYRPQGAGVLVNLNGQNALEAIDPQLYERMKARSVSVLGGESMDKDGKNGTFREMGKMFGINLQEKYGKNLFFLGWHEIRGTLYEGLPPGVVDFGRRYASYDDQGSDGVLVKMKDGSSLRARLLIGADGYFSKVRTQMLDDGPPEFTGNIMWRARFPLRQGFSTDRTRWWRENLDRFGGRFAVIFPIDRNHVTFVANAPVEHLHRHNLPFQADTSRSVQEDVYEKDNLQRCLTVFQDFDERLLEVLRDTDPSTVTEHGLYERPVDKMTDEGWCRGNVTIIGDAAHAGLPNGQGLNLAIEDGAVLGWHLREGGVNPESLRRFNAERGPRVRDVLTKGLDSNQGPEKIKVIYEATFRPVQGNRSEYAQGEERPAPEQRTCTHLPTA